MKTRTLLLGACASFALATSANAGTINGWYVGLEGGGNWIEEWNHTQVTPGPVLTPATASYDTGWAAFGTVGYGFNHWRLEFEGGYRDNDLDGYVKAGVPFPSVTGELRETSLMLNALYDIPVTNRITLSLGAGAGADFAQIDFALPAINDDNWSFAYQGLAGLSYDLTPQWALFVNYRYFRATDPSFDFRPVTATNFDGDDFVKHTATIGLRYAFGAEPAPEPVVAAPPPPPPPPAPEAARQFIIFFGFNKCNITAEADGVLSQAATAAKDLGSAAIQIVGHTDTSGSPKYNQKLSECRANAAKKNLVGKGVAAGSISASGKGETELMVQTADGVKEPQNRRAQVDLQ